MTLLSHESKLAAIPPQPVFTNGGDPITVPGRDSFHAAEWFRDGKRNSDGIRIASVREPFREHFLDKVEENVPEARVRSLGVTQTISGPEALVGLEGSLYGAELTLAHMYELMRRTVEGKGVSLQAGVNIFCIRDSVNILRLVDAFWVAGNRTWIVDAFPPTAEGFLFHGDQVLVRA